MATIAIEFLVILIILFIIFVWFVWFKITKKYSQWRYKPENDKGKQGEEHRQELIRAGLPDPIRAVATTIAADAATVDGVGRQGEPEGRGDVQAASSFDAGEASSGTGETIKPKRKFRNPLRRRWK